MDKNSSMLRSNLMERYGGEKENLVYSGFTSLVTSLILSVIFPLQFYVQAQDYLNFSIWYIFSDCVALFFTLLPLLFVLLFFSNKIFGFLLHFILLSFLLYLTLEAGILSYNLPKLDGNLDNYSNIFRMLLDSSIALFLLLAPFVFYEKIRKNIFLLGTLTLMLSLTFIFELQAESEKGLDELAITSTVPRHLVVENLAYAKKNTIVFIVDAISTEVVESVLNDHPDLKAKMPGFINFTNNVGMHIQTSVAIPGIFSGEYFSNPHELNLYSNKVYSSSSFLKTYKDMGSTIFINLLLPDFSYTNKILDRRNDKKTLRLSNGFNTRMEGMFPFNIMEYYAFKISPYAFKRVILSKLLSRWESTRGDGIVTDEAVYNILAEALVDTSITSSLHVHHFKGGHPPLVFDENGVKIKSSQLTYQAYYNRVYLEFKRMTGLFDRLRQRGLYDDSFVLILADHGLEIFEKPKTKSAPNKAFPALMVKNRNASRKFSNNSTPTSHSNVSHLMKTIPDAAISDLEIVELLKSDKRLYRQAFHNQLQDFIIDKNYEVQFKQYLVEKDPLKLKPLNTDYAYRFKNFNNPNYPDFLTNGSRTSGVGLDFYKSQPGELIFRLPKPNFRYSVHINIVPWGTESTSYNGAYRFSSGGAKVEHSFQSRDDIELADVLTDDNGLVRLSVVAIDPNYHLAFFSITVGDALD